jgi:hypothetical protein
MQADITTQAGGGNFMEVDFSWLTCAVERNRFHVNRR